MFSKIVLTEIYHIHSNFCDAILDPCLRKLPYSLEIKDRGPMDGKAYLSDEKWKKILNERGATEADLRDTR